MKRLVELKRQGMGRQYMCGARGTGQGVRRLTAVAARGGLLLGVGRFRVLCATLLLLPVAVGGQQGEPDPVDALLSVKRNTSPEHIRKMDEVIAASPKHPRILDLKRHRLSVVMGDPLTEAHQRSVVRQARKVAQECQAAGRQNLAFHCEVIIGSILQNHLRDLPAAYKHYRGMERHPALKNHDLPTDVRRMELCASLTEVAWGLPERNVAAVRKYAQLIMAYLYLGIEDRKIYRRLRGAYTRGVTVYMQMLAMTGDTKTLIGLEIPPSQRLLQRIRRSYVKQALSRAGVATEFDPLEGLERSLDTPLATASTQPSVLHTQPISRASPRSVSGQPLADAVHVSRDRQVWPWIAGVAGVVVVVGGFTWWKRSRRGECQRAERLE